MTDDSTKLPPGGSVEILLKRRRRQPVKRAATPPDEKQRGILHVDDETPRYLRRLGGTISFYDLGTRLRSVAPNTIFNGLRYRGINDRDTPAPQDDYYNEYVELQLDMPGETMVKHGLLYFNNVVASEFKRQEQIMLGSRALGIPDNQRDPLDPFGFSVANGSSRRLPHAMELHVGLPFPNWIGIASPGEVQRASSPLYPSGENAGDPLWLQDILLNLPEFQFKIRDAIRGDDRWVIREDNPNERWNPHNISSGAAFRNYLPNSNFYKSAPAGHLMVGQMFRNFLDQTGQLVGDSAPQYWLFSPDGPIHAYLTRDDYGIDGFTEQVSGYWGFDTGDTVKYKVTAEPSFSAPAVDYTFKGRDNRIYLRPRQQAYVLLDPLNYPDGNPLLDPIPLSGWASRFPVYPGFHTHSCTVRRSLLSRISEVTTEKLYVFPHLNGVYLEPGYGEFVRTLPTLPPGSLVAAIAQGGTIYYVWHVTGVSWPIGVSAPGSPFDPIPECE